MIILKNIYYQYDSKVVLNDIHLSIKEKERIVILGINGCGKTTLLKILNALIFPQKGSYTYNDVLITEKKIREKDFSRRFRREVVLLFQNPDVMLFNPTVYDEIAFSLRQLQLIENEVKDRVLYWANLFELTSFLDLPPFKLSGGQKQKLCLACLLAIEPKFLLLDEPTANLDPKTSGWLIDLLYDLQIATVVTTHNISLAPELGERLIVMGENHRIIYDGPTMQFLNDKEKMLAAGLLHKHRHRHGNVEHSHYHFHDF